MAKLNFNDHLDDMMERLMNEDIKEQELDLEIRRAKALCQIAEKKIAHQKVVIDAARAVSSGDVQIKWLSSFQIEEKK